MSEIFRPVRTSAAKREIAIKLPFTISKFGIVDYTNNQNEIIGDRVRTVISTAFGERIYRKDFGTNLGNELYNPIGTVQDLIASEITKAFSKWLGSLTLIEVRVSSDDLDGTIEIAVDYQLPNLELDTIKLSGFASINSDGTITEVTL
jgi:phage baseplate assembly protein W